jgi:hypothetical protein
MNIYIGNLPKQVTLLDLKIFLGNVELQANCKQQAGIDSKAEHYFFIIAKTESAQQGEELIKNFNGKTFSGKSIIVRELIDRYQSIKANAPEKLEIERRINPY